MMKEKNLDSCLGELKVVAQCEASLNQTVVP
jgi:hypothetical protein